MNSPSNTTKLKGIHRYTERWFRIAMIIVTMVPFVKAHREGFS